MSDAIREKLGEASEVVELGDPAGHILGHFVPAVQAGPGEVPDDCPYSPEELARMQSETGGRTLAEIRADLGWS